MGILDALPGLNQFQNGTRISPLDAGVLGLLSRLMPQLGSPAAAAAPGPAEATPPVPTGPSPALRALMGLGPPAPMGSPSYPTAGQPPGLPGAGMSLGDVVQKAAEAGIPPPPNVSSVNVTPATVGGVPPQGQMGAPAATAAALPSPAGTAITPPLPAPMPMGATSFPDISTFFKNALMPKTASGENAKPPVGTNAPKVASPAPAPEEKKGERPNSPLAAVRPPPAPQGLNPSTPAAIQPRAIDLDPMTALVRQILASRQQQTVLPQLSAFLQRRPQS